MSDTEKIEQFIIDFGFDVSPNGDVYLGCGQWYNMKTKKASLTSEGSFRTLPEHLYEV